MYTIVTSSKKVNKEFRQYECMLPDMRKKLERISNDPRSACGAHPLHGTLKNLWASWLRANVRLVYRIDDEQKMIIVEKIGPHSIYD